MGAYESTIKGSEYALSKNYLPFITNKDDENILYRFSKD